MSNIGIVESILNVADEKLRALKEEASIGYRSEIEDIDIFLCGYLSRDMNKFPEEMFEHIETIKAVLQTQENHNLSLNQVYSLYINQHKNWEQFFDNLVANKLTMPENPLKKPIRKSFLDEIFSPNIFQRNFFGSCKNPQIDISEIQRISSKTGIVTPQKTIKAIQQLPNMNVDLEELRKKQELEENKDNNCGFCFGNLVLTEGMESWGLFNCGHCFHKTCLSGYVKFQIESSKIPVKCPEENCNQDFAMIDLREFMDKQLSEKFEKFAFQQFVSNNSETISWCPTVGCLFVFEMSKGIVIDNFKCPQCSKSYCLHCRTSIHKGVTCQQNQMNLKLTVFSFSQDDENKTLDYLKGLKCKECQNCKRWIEKTEVLTLKKGCNHMICKCKYEFCFVCGEKFGVCGHSYYGT